MRRQAVSIASTGALLFLAMCTDDPVPTADALDAGAHDAEVLIVPDAGEADADAGDASTRRGCEIADLQKKYAAKATEIDLDCDGRIDWRIKRAPNGDIQSETIDVNGDGKPDMTWVHAAEPQTLRADRDLDGRIDYAVDRSHVAGSENLDFVESWDPIGTGKLTTRNRFTVDPEEPSFHVLREELDENGDWNIVFGSTERVLQKKIPAIITGGGAADGCTADQVKKIESALEGAATAIDCLATYDPHLALRVLKVLTQRTLQIKCQAIDHCGHSTNAGKGICLFGFCSLPMEVVIGQQSFTNPGCASLSATLFHEILHYTVGLHKTDDGGLSDPNDQVFGCEELCGGTPTNATKEQSCAACLQTTTSDARCNKHNKGKPNCKPPPPPKGFCDCDTNKKSVYPDETQCRVECPSGIVCFAASCYPLNGPMNCGGKGMGCDCGCCPGLRCTNGKCQ